MLFRSTWKHEMETMRRYVGAELKIGATEFTVSFLSPDIRAVVPNAEVSFEHIRSQDFWEKLESGKIDILCGGVIFDKDEGFINTNIDIEALIFYKSQLRLLTTLSSEELPGKSVSKEKLPTHHVVLPQRGIILDFLSTHYGSNWQDIFKDRSGMDELYFGLHLLQNKIVHGSMLVEIGRASCRERV